MTKAVPAQPGDLAVQLLPWEGGAQDIGAEVQVEMQCGCYPAYWLVQALCPLAAGVIGSFDGSPLLYACRAGEYCCLPKRVLFKKQDDNPETAKTVSPRSKEFAR